MSDQEENPEPVELKYKIKAEDFELNYEVIEIIREEEKSSHLIVEDTEYGDIYYVKRMIIDKKETFKKYQNYYQTLEEFTQSNFSPMDMVKLWAVSEHYSKEEENWELLTYFEWGEPDCIDLARLTKIQTLKFLKNITEILDTTYNITKLTHNNICLDNIILVNTQLKLGGWKPFLLSNGIDDDYLHWKEFIIRNYGRGRLDLCMLGLLWLELLQVKIGDVFLEQNMVFPKFLSLVNSKIGLINKEKGDEELIKKIFNFDAQFDYLNLKLKLDEMLIYEEAKRMDEEKKLKQLSQPKREGLFERVKEDSFHLPEPSDCETGAFHDPLEGSPAVLDLNTDDLCNMSFAEKEVNTIGSEKEIKPLMKTYSLGKLMKKENEHVPEIIPERSIESTEKKGYPTNKSIDDTGLTLSGREAFQRPGTDILSEREAESKDYNQPNVNKNLNEGDYLEDPQTFSSHKSFSNNSKGFSPSSDIERKEYNLPKKAETPEQKYPYSRSHGEDLEEIGQIEGGERVENVEHIEDSDDEDYDNNYELKEIGDFKQQEDSLEGPDSNAVELDSEENYSLKEDKEDEFLGKNQLNADSPQKSDYDEINSMEDLKSQFDKRWDEAEELFAQKRFAECIDIWLSLEQEAQGSDLAQIYKFVGICHNYLKEGYKAIQFLEKSLKSYENMKIEDFELKASIYKHLGVANFEAHAHSKALEHFLKSFEIKKEYLNSPPNEIFEILQLIGDSEYNLSAYKDALESFNCCLALVKKQKEDFTPTEQFRIVKKIGICLKKMNDNEKAISIFLEANRIEGNIPPKERGIANSNLGSCYMTEGLLEESMKHYEKAIEYFKEANLLEEVSRCYFYLGVSELRQKRNNSALEYFDISLDFRKQIGKDNNSEAGLIHSQKGIVYLIIGENEIAVKEFDRASKCFSSSRRQELLECFTNLGQAYLNLGKEEAARRNFNKALDFRKSNQSNPILSSRCYFNLGNIYYKLGEAGLAIKNFSSALQCYDNWSRAPKLDIFTCLYKTAKLFIDIDKQRAITKFAEAIEVCNQSGLGDPELFKSHFYRGYTYKLSNDFAGATEDMEKCLSITLHHESAEGYLSNLFMAEINLALDRPKVAKIILDEFIQTYDEEKATFIFLKGDPIEGTNLILNYHLLMRLFAEKDGNNPILTDTLEKLIDMQDPLIEDRKKEMRLKLAEVYLIEDRIPDCVDQINQIRSLYQGDREVMDKCEVILEQIEELKRNELDDLKSVESSNHNSVVSKSSKSSKNSKGSKMINFVKYDPSVKSDDQNSYMTSNSTDYKKDKIDLADSKKFIQTGESNMLNSMRQNDSELNEDKIIFSHASPSKKVNNSLANDLNIGSSNKNQNISLNSFEKSPKYNERRDMMKKKKIPALDMPEEHAKSGGVRIYRSSKKPKSVRESEDVSQRSGEKARQSYKNTPKKSPRNDKGSVVFKSSPRPVSQALGSNSKKNESSHKDKPRRKKKNKLLDDSPKFELNTPKVTPKDKNKKGLRPRRQKKVIKSKINTGRRRRTPRTRKKVKKPVSNPNDEINPEMKTELRAADLDKIKVVRNIEKSRNNKPGSADDLVKYIRNFLVRIENLIDQNHLEEVDKFLARFKTIIKESEIKVHTIKDEIIFKDLLDARLFAKKGYIDRADAILTDCMKNIDPNSFVAIHKIYLVKIEIRRKRQRYLEGLDYCTDYLMNYNQTSTTGTLKILKLFFSIVEDLNIRDYNKVTKNKLRSIVKSQEMILQSIEKLISLKFTNIAVPPSLFKDKRLECLLILASSSLLLEDIQGASSYLDTFIDGLNFISGDRILLVKEAIETLVAADEREMAVHYIEKISKKRDNWDGENKNYYFALIMTKLGSFELNDGNYTMALRNFDKALDYFKDFKNSDSISTNLSADVTNKMLFDILHSIATCCLEENGVDKASDFCETARSIAKNTEDESKSLFLAAKISHMKGNDQEALKLLGNSTSIWTPKKGELQAVETCYYQGKIYQNMGKKERAFTCFKRARRMLESGRDAKFYDRLKDKLDDAFLSFQ